MLVPKGATIGCLKLNEVARDIGVPREYISVEVERLECKNRAVCQIGPPISAPRTPWNEPAVIPLAFWAEEHETSVRHAVNRNLIAMAPCLEVFNEGCTLVI